MIIDVHAHALNETFLAGLVRKPAFGLAARPDGEGGYLLQIRGGPWASLDKLLHDLPTRLESLKRRDVDLQFVGPQPGILAHAEGAGGVDLCRAVNQHTAEVVAESGGRLGGLAVVPFGEPERAVDELERAVDTHGFKGAMIATTPGGRPLDDPAYERLGLLVFMHPVLPPNPERFAEYRLGALVCLPAETSLAVARLIFTGVLERHPNWHLVLAHGGGDLAFLRGRLDMAYNAVGWEAEPACRAHISKPPSEYYRQLFFDTVVGSTPSIRFLVDLVGADRVMFGTDYPFEIGDPEGALALPGIRSLPPEDQRKIMGDNAAGILGIAASRVAATLHTA